MKIKIKIIREIRYLNKISLFLDLSIKIITIDINDPKIAARLPVIIRLIIEKNNVKKINILIIIYLISPQIIIKKQIGILIEK